MADFDYTIQIRVEAKNSKSSRDKMKKVREKIQKVKGVYVEEMSGSKIDKNKKVEVEDNHE